MKTIKMSITPVDVPEEEIKGRWHSISELLFDMTMRSLQEDKNPQLYKAFAQFIKKREGGETKNGKTDL
ncbi:MAG: hypothetical protein WC851_05505 [Candidatus Shapirobacteria bacterium]|jgi:hypothetical protein